MIRITTILILIFSNGKSTHGQPTGNEHLYLDIQDIQNDSITYVVRNIALFEFSRKYTIQPSLESLSITSK